MPHVIVKLHTGRTEEQKQKLADAIAKDAVAVLGCEDRVVSVAFEEVEKAAWPEAVYRPDILEKEKTLYKKPGYNPFDHK